MSWAIVKFLTVPIFNRYLNDSEYYHDIETIIWIHILSIFHLRQRNQVPLLEPFNRNTHSSSWRSISQELFLAIFSYFIKWLWVCWSKTMFNAHAQNHISTIMIVVISYHCHDSNNDDNASHTITTIAQPHLMSYYNTQ